MLSEERNSNDLKINVIKESYMLNTVSQVVDNDIERGNSSSNNSSSNNSSSNNSSEKAVLKGILKKSNYTGTTTGSPTVTTNGPNTVLTFNGSGSYTA